MRIRNDGKNFLLPYPQFNQVKEVTVGKFLIIRPIDPGWYMSHQLKPLREGNGHTYPEIVAGKPSDYSPRTSRSKTILKWRLNFPDWIYL
jgi:hypothetical protein